MASFEGDPPTAAAPKALLDRRELALVAVERTRMPMVITDPRQPDNPIVIANQAFLDLTGYEADEVVGRNCRFLQGPDTDTTAVEKLRRGLDAGREHVSAELLNYRKDGSSFWNELAISPVMGESGELIYYFASQRDATETRRIKQLEAAERLLLMEIDHRAINALAIVKSIVRLSQAETVADLSASLQGRIEALARAHRLLAGTGWIGGDLETLLAEEIPGAFACRVSGSGPSVMLPSACVQPLALVLHEMMANAAQHGALSRSDGEVIVQWKEAGRQLLLDWQENGAIGLRSAPEPRFGLRMLLGLVEQQMNGSVAMTGSDQGLRIGISLPLHHRTDDGPMNGGAR
ncbi:blue-light-activated histidine kinase [Teichococcus vastitatis]|uniref:blue-light-activated histidine kinase n=1 Tax=Teichococcus vastitatis TaxID=2307076 RepID=UPI000E7115D8|nr:PAS domain-containing protein [Pseudoroseomonas vastitatis]